MLSPDRQANIDKAVKALYDYIDSLPPEGAVAAEALTRHTNLAVVQRLQAKINALEAEKRQKKHMEEVNAKYKEMHGL